jgi:colanic acid/amylovoran biosynthesis protein
VKIGVTNAVLSNTGDASIYQAIVDSLGATMPDRPLHVVAFDSDADVTSKLYPEWQIFQQLTVSPPRRPARLRSGLQRVRHTLVRELLAGNHRLEHALRLPIVRRSRFSRSLRELRSCDVVISSGGTYLVDHYDFSPRVLEFRLAKTFGKRIVLWTQSLGPFARERSERAIRDASVLIDEMYFRDERSASAWNRLGLLEVPREVVADAVFALEIPDRSERRDRLTEAPQAVLSVRQWSRGVDSDLDTTSGYEEMMRAGAARLSALGWDTVALSTCQGVPSYAYDDSEEAARIFAGTDVAIDSGFHRPLELVDELLASELVVSTRMHLAILALLAKRPVIAIAYEFKTLELFRSIGLGDFVVKIEDASAEWLESRIDQLVADPSLAVLSDEMLLELRKSAAVPAESFARSLSGESRS